MIFLLIILALFSPNVTYNDAIVSDKIMSKNSQGRLKSHEAMKIGHKAIQEHYKINIEESDLCFYDKGDYYIITVKIPENSLGGGVTAKVDAYSGKVLKVFFTE